ncbi:autotransporter outer membrane beta-barrel domain-containing protein [Kiloniella litopenaei]|uniref:autotransporter family protein n=1 Tax=Kiloniella litopenaei TaxID=1549748 RepID=UPI003BAD1BDE
MSREKIFCLIFCLFTVFGINFDANAGHQFSQASHGQYTNGNVVFSAGQSLTVTQTQGFENTLSNGQIQIGFVGDFGAGDSVSITIGAYSETFSFDAPGGYTINASGITGNSAALAAANIVVSNTSSFVIKAESGSFTWESYRFYVTNGVFNGSNSSEINQATLDAANGYTPNSSSGTTNGVAGVLDGLSGTATGDMAAVMTTLDNLSNSQKSERMKKLIPDATGSAAQTAAVAVNGGLDTVKVRISEAFSEIGSTQAVKGNNIRDTGLSSGDGALEHSFWMKAFFEHANQDDVSNSRGDFAGYEGDVWGTSFGVDTTLDNGVLIGGAYSYSNANVNMTDFQKGNGTDISTHQVTPYAAYSENGWTYELMTAFVYHDFESNRDTATTGVANADYYGLQFSAQALTSYQFDLTNNISFSPEIGIGYDYVYTSDYKETGAGVLNLDVDSTTSTRIRSILGATLAADYNLNGVATQPYLGVQWTREFRRDGANTTSAFLGGGDAFSTETQRLDADKFSLGVGTTVEINEANSFSIAVTGEKSTNYYGYGGQAMYRLSF